MGYQNYAEGEWHIAKRILLNTHQMLGFPDGPSEALLRCMSAAPFYFSAPENWKGVHSLQSMVDVHNGLPVREFEKKLQNLPMLKDKASAKSAEPLSPQAGASPSSPEKELAAPSTLRKAADAE